MSNAPSDTPGSFRRKPVRTSLKVVANAARAALGLRDEEQAFELPAVEADDNCLYYVKGDAHGRSVRASEWICTQIAEAVGIAAPAAAAIELQNGGSVFGSRRIAGVADAAITTAYLTSSSASNIGIQAQGHAPDRKMVKKGVALA
jgi:hypothetical protein